MRSEKNENSKSNVNEERTESFHTQMRKNKTRQNKKYTLSLLAVGR